MSVVKLLDFRHRWADLEASDHPFAGVVMARVHALEIRRDATCSLLPYRRVIGLMADPRADEHVACRNLLRNLPGPLPAG